MSVMVARLVLAQVDGDRNLDRERNMFAYRVEFEGDKTLWHKYEVIGKAELVSRLLVSSSSGEDVVILKSTTMNRFFYVPASKFYDGRSFEIEREESDIVKEV